MNGKVLRLAISCTLLGGTALGLAAVFANSSAPVQLTLEQMLPPGHDDSSYWRGEPVPLRLDLRYPTAETAAARAHNAGQPGRPVPVLRLVGPSQAWTDWVTLRLERQTGIRWELVGGPIDWRAGIVAGTEGGATASVIAARPLSVPFSLPPSMTEQLPAGKYRITGVLDTRRAAGGDWQGRVTAAAGFTLRALPADQTEQSRVYVQRARYAADVQRDAAAAQQLAARATRLDPANGHAWYELMTAAQRNRDWRTVVAAGRKYLSLPSQGRPEADSPRNIVEALVGFAERRQPSGQ